MPRETTAFFKNFIQGFTQEPVVPIQARALRVNRPSYELLCKKYATKNSFSAKFKKS